MNPPDTSATPSSSHLAIVGGLLLVLAGLATYWPGLHGGYLFDDYPNLVHAQAWKVTAMDATQWRRAATDGNSNGSNRPLAMLSFAANHIFTGMQPFPLKLTNLLLHLCNGLLVLALCSRLMAHMARNGTGPPPSRLTAWLVAMAWTLHPLQVSTVLYVVQRMELGAQGAVLLSLLAYLHGRQAQVAGRRGWPWLALAMVAMAVGLGFKESTLLAPAYMLLIELFVLRFAGPGGARHSRGWIGAYATATAAAAVAFLVVVLPRYLPDAAWAMRDFSLTERLWTQLPVLATYLKQMLFPVPGSLLFYYDHFPISSGLWSPPMTALATALLLGLVVVACLCRKRQPLVSFGIAWFFVSHALTSNVIPLELAFEHRNYLAILGVLLALVPPLTYLGNRLNADARRTLAILPILALAALTAIQTHTWGDPLRLAMAQATRNPESSRAGYELGKRLLESTGNHPGAPQWSLAKEEFEHAAALPNSAPLADQALIIMTARTGRLVPVETWNRFHSKLTRRRAGPQEIEALYSISQCRMRGGCSFDDAQLVRIFADVLQRNPRSPALHTMYADYAFNALGDHALGIAMMREAAGLAPHNPQYRAGLVKLILASNLLDSSTEEVEYLIQGLRLENRDGSLDSELRLITQLQARNIDN